jgi:hypothetical protein
MHSGSKTICLVIALITLSVFIRFLAAHAQGSSDYYHVANTQPPDAYLAMRSAPSMVSGQRIEEMPNGTPLEILEKRPDGWWLVRNVKTGHQGWALSGSPTTRWIDCCTNATPALAQSPSFDCSKAYLSDEIAICQNPSSLS